MLQAQDLVLGFARFLGGSFAGSRASGISTDASGGLLPKKTAGQPEAARDLDSLSKNGPSQKRATDQATARKNFCANRSLHESTSRRQPFCVH